MYEEARPARHVTCQYSYSFMKKFVQLVKMKKKKNCKKNGRFGEKDMRVEKKRERERERERER